jgi:dTDP-4-dehydrorhamnose reductase
VIQGEVFDVAVDQAESEADRAFAVNLDWAAYLAKFCEKVAIPLVHISTDYFYVGSMKPQSFAL